MKPAFLAINLLLIVSAIDCTKNPVAPAPPSPNRSDTTSHNYSWQIFSFGGGGGSILNDVAIINDTLVYAVGEIYLADSAEQYDRLPYNFAIWNGTSWNLKKVAVNFRGNLIIPPLDGIFYFSPSDIWLVGSLPIHGDGENWIIYDVRSMPGFENFSLSKAWGKNSSDIFFIGGQGSLVHYSNGIWQKINSGTTLPINDIWGAQISAGQWEILAIASNPDSTADMLLQINSNNTVTPLSTNGLLPFTNGVWFVPEKRYYVVGSGIGQKSSLNDPNWSVYPSGVVTSYASGGVRGSGLNNVFVAGSFFEIVHYNGSTWHNYKDVIPFTDGAVGSMAVNGDIMVTVGLSGQNAVAIIGKRE